MEITVAVLTCSSLLEAGVREQGGTVPPRHAADWSWEVWNAEQRVCAVVWTPELRSPLPRFAGVRSDPGPDLEACNLVSWQPSLLGGAWRTKAQIRRPSALTFQ